MLAQRHFNLNGKTSLTSQASLQQPFFVNSEFANRMNLLNTIGTELDLGCKEFNTLVLVERAVDEGRLNNTAAAIRSSKQALSETSTSHSHGKSGRASTILGLDDLITTKLDTIDQVVELLACDIVVTGLGDQRDNGNAGVTTDNSDVLIGRIGTLELGDEAGSTDDIEGGDTEETLGIVDTLALEDFGDDGNGRVDLGGY